MKIGILGTGNLAEAMATALTKKNYHVMVGARDVEKARRFTGELGHYAKAGTIANAIHYGEVIILAVPYKSVDEVLGHIDTYKDKIVVDATNPLIFKGMAELALGHETSAAEQIAQMVPEAKVIKAFNTAFTETYEFTSFGPNEASMFYCGDDSEAKDVVKKIILDLDLDPVDCGPLDSARLLEPLATLIIRIGVNMGQGREIAWKLLKRE
ncbi:MAG: NADPH-dependent F420 reductase [Bacteroidota bacterium]